jgi:hypothetical protein
MQSLSEDSRATLAPALERAEFLDTAVGPWRVYISGDRTLDSALFNARYTYESSSIGSVEVYHRKRGDDDIFITVAGIFPDKPSAENAAINARSRVRVTANVVDMSGLCPNATRTTETTVSGTTGAYNVVQYECMPQ